MDEQPDERPIGLDGDLIDLSGIQLGDLPAIDGTAFGNALLRILSETREPDESIARFPNRM